MNCPDRSPTGRCHVSTVDQRTVREGVRNVEPRDVVREVRAGRVPPHNAARRIPDDKDRLGRAGDVVVQKRERPRGIAARRRLDHADTGVDVGAAGRDGGPRRLLPGPARRGPRGGAALVALNNVSYVRIQGLEIRNYRTDDRRRTPAGIRVSGGGSHIEILKNNVHHIEQNFQGRDRPGSGGNGFGIAVYGTDPKTPISDLLIDGNEVHHLKTGSSESLVLNGNVAGFRVTHNTVHDNNNIGIDLIGHERTAPDPEVDRARDGVISGNLVYNITSKGNPAYGDEVNSDGIYVDGGTRLLIERNIMHDVDFGIELASEHFGKTTSYITARNNLIYNCHTAGITIGGYDAKRGITEDCIIANNTLYNNDTWSTETGEFMMQFYMRNNLFVNNIIYVGKHGRAMTSKSGRMDPNTPTVTMDHNLYYFPGGAKAAGWRFDDQDYPSFEDYVKTTGNDRNSRFADPLFVNPAANDFQLRKGSPARGAGRDAGAAVTGAMDLAGAPRKKGGKIDVGCYQAH